MAYMMTWIEGLVNNRDWQIWGFDTLLDTMVTFDGEIHIRMGVGLWHETGIYTKREWR